MIGFAQDLSFAQNIINWCDVDSRGLKFAVASFIVLRLRRKGIAIAARRQCDYGAKPMPLRRIGKQRILARWPPPT